ncbi:MAG TPA: CsgG/HfaB family protein [Verrucomicrobiae bacterium]|nr:CsgG/HfaB family protein [Verrucomicrobiae bacterium]
MERALSWVIATLVVLMPLSTGAQDAPTPAPTPYSGPHPRVAVMDFTTVGLTGTGWYGQFQPGVAISDLLTDQLVQGGKFDVVDRTALDKTLAEHQLSSSGEVDPRTAITAGHLIGARYLISGNVSQMEMTGSSNGAAGALIGGLVGAVVGGIHTRRVTLKLTVKVVDSLTGEIVEVFPYENTVKGTSWGSGGFGGGVAGAYSNSSFLSSDLGHLVNDAAIAIAANLDPTKFISGPIAPTLRGHIAAVESDGTVVINLGSDNGVTEGEQFTMIKRQTIIDPESHQALSVDKTMGILQIDSVSSKASIGHVIDGKAATLLDVVSIPNP